MVFESASPIVTKITSCARKEAVDEANKAKIGWVGTRGESCSVGSHQQATHTANRMVRNLHPNSIGIQGMQHCERNRHRLLEDKQCDQLKGMAT